MGVISRISSAVGKLIRQLTEYLNSRRRLDSNRLRRERTGENCGDGRYAGAELQTTVVIREYTSRPGLKIGNESVPKIILNDTIISILVISNHNSFRLTFDKIAPVYFI